MSTTTPSGSVISEKSNLQGSLKVISTQLPLYESTRAGRTFHGGQAAAGAVLPIFSNTAQVVGLWNPSGSGIVAVLTQVTYTYVSTTGAAGGFVLGAVRNTGSGVATGGPVAAFTDGVLFTTVWPGLLGNTATPKARFTPSAATVTAPVIYKHLGQNQLVTTATTATATSFEMRDSFLGDVVIAPGNALFVAGNIATLITLAVGISWVEESEAGEV